LGPGSIAPPAPPLPPVEALLLVVAPAPVVCPPTVDVLLEVSVWGASSQLASEHPTIHAIAAA
jgi:hypothetical protein